MKKLALAFAVLAAALSFSSAATAGYYDDGYSYKRSSYRHHDYQEDYCYTKKIAYYDDYGYLRYKRIRVCH